MRNLQKSLQREIACFAEAIASEGGSIPEVSKAAFCKARKKLKPSAFEALMQIVANKFYEKDHYNRWHGLRVLGVDGSTAELPNSKEIKEEYGVFKTRSDGKDICMSRMLTIYDTLNHLTVHGALDTIQTSETSMLWKALPQLDLRGDDVLVFDRYYASHLLMFYLAQRGAQFCFRMKKNWWKVVERFYNSGAQSQLITLSLPAKDKQTAGALGIEQTGLRVRLVRIELESGETEILLTSLTDTEAFGVADLKELYGLRWSIEESYKAFKHKVCVEHFSGKSQRAVLQDFYVKLFIMNLTAVAVQPINEALKKQTVKVKYAHQVNFTEALFSMRKAVVSFFITGTTAQALQRLYRRLFSSTEPLRPGRKFKRPKLQKKKFHMNYKQT